MDPNDQLQQFATSETVDQMEPAKGASVEPAVLDGAGSDDVSPQDVWDGLGYIPEFEDNEIEELEQDRKRELFSTKVGELEQYLSDEGFEEDDLRRVISRLEDEFDSNNLLLLD